jgi:hypothetical protein
MAHHPHSAARKLRGASEEREAVNTPGLGTVHVDGRTSLQKVQEE